VTRGVAHPDSLRAEAVAAVLAGTAIAQVARQYGIDKSVVSRWVATDATHPARARHDPEELADLIVDLVESHVHAIHAQLQAASRPEWLEKQTAAELAALVAVERDTAIRLLAGLRPADDQPALEPPAGAPESATG